jgi:hypothetical protein
MIAIVSHPADVMVSKLNADRKAGESAGTAIARIYKNIGFSGLWNGLPVRIGMIGTLTAFQWLIYDSFKVYLGVSSFFSFFSSFSLDFWSFGFLDGWMDGEVCSRETIKGSEFLFLVADVGMVLVADDGWTLNR